MTAEELAQLVKEAIESVLKVNDLNELRQLKSHYLGKQGVLTESLKSLGKLSAEERPRMGQAINQAKQTLIAALNDAEANIERAALDARLNEDALDITLPGRQLYPLGSRHPINRVRRRVESLFKEIGFVVHEGPEVEDEEHNFDLLNISADHPARQELDTFFLEGEGVLRTHTSPVQIRVMQEQKAPIRMITPGRVYRRDSDQTHTPMFHQLEGLVIDQQSNFSELQGLLRDFFTKFFERPVKLRFRPSYFPFTVISAEVDIAFESGQDEGADSSQATDWLEVLGCGMVHPNVLTGVGVDPEQYQGYAFGLGLDRLAMLRYGIPDLRTFFQNDIRFLSQFT